MIPRNWRPQEQLINRAFVRFSLRLWRISDRTKPSRLRFQDIADRACNLGVNNLPPLSPAPAHIEDQSFWRTSSRPYSRTNSALQRTVDASTPQKLEAGRRTARSTLK
jgi:hypothetical protein